MTYSRSDSGSGADVCFAIEAEGKPYLGFLQPGSGFEGGVSFCSVTRRSKKDKGSSPLRAFLADTVVSLRDRKYASLPSETARNKALAKEADVSLSQIQRVIDGAVGASIDVIDALAKALDVRPQDLVTPYFVAQPAPPEYKPPPEAEEIQRRQGSGTPNKRDRTA